MGHEEVAQLFYKLKLSLWALDVAQLVERLPGVCRALGLMPYHRVKADLVAHACNPRVGVVEARGSGIQGHPWLYRELVRATTTKPEYFALRKT